MRYCSGSLELELRGHVLHREVVGDERVDQAAEGEGDQQRTGACAAGRATAIQTASPRAAPTSGRTPCTSATHERERQRELSEFGNHLRALWRHARCAAVSCALFDRVCGLRRHVVLVVLGEHFAARGTRRRRRAGPAPPRPCPRGTGRAARRCRPPACVFAVSVTMKCTVDAVARASRCPSPPCRRCGRCVPAALRWRRPAMGVKKNTRFFWKAESTSAAATPSAATPAAMATSRL